MKFYSKIAAGIGCLVLSMGTIQAQDSVLVSDFESWNNISLRTSFLDDKLDINLDEALRFNENASSLGMVFTEIGAKYEIYKNLKLGAAYRFINERDEKTGNKQYRYQFDLMYARKFERLRISGRFRFQNRDYCSGSAGDSDYGTKKIRLRLKFDYNIPKWKLDPYFSVEAFRASTKEDKIQYIDEVETGTIDLSGMEKMRYTFGTSFKPFKRAEIGLYYRIEKEFGSFPYYLETSTPFPATFYIVGFNFNYRFKFKKKEESND